MAETRLVDVVPVSAFEKIVLEQLDKNSKYRQSGVVTSSDPRVQKLVSTAGFETTMPFWKRPAGGSATNGSDNPASKATPKKVQQGNMIARILARSESFSAMDIADFASDADAIAYVASEFARLRLEDEESALLAITQGVVAKGGADFLVAKHITTGTIADANLFGTQTVVASRKKLGDMGGSLKAYIMHSDVVNNLRAREPNAFVPASKTDIGMETYLGGAVIETDNVGKAGTESFPIYTTYHVGPELFAYANAPVEHALVQFRDELAGDGTGQETILNRWRYALHPYGFSNAVAPTNGVSQSNTELADEDTWTLVASSRKTVPLVAITTNG